MARLFAKKHKYEIKPNQVIILFKVKLKKYTPLKIKTKSINKQKFSKELFAYGVINIVASAFKGFPGCVSLSRCVILDGVGGRTQVSGIFSSILVLIVTIFLGPFIQTLPKACLASIIVVALKNIVIEVFTELPKIMKKSKLEAVSFFF
jgi:MFS superfamily sulfate permease-like transporter